MNKLLLLALLLPVLPCATVLGDAAASLSAEEWQKLPVPANVSEINIAGSITPYADSWVWNPITKKGMFIGSCHNCRRVFAVYDDATHTWSHGDLAGSGIPVGPVTSHAYDGNAMDPATGTFYWRESNGLKRIFRYRVDGSWSVLPGTGANLKEVEPLSFFPELGGLVWVNRPNNGNIYWFSESTMQWTQLGKVGFSLGTWTVAEYNPVHKVMIIGSGNADKMVRLTSDGTVSALSDFPETIYDGSGYAGHLMVDPVSGDYLVLTARCNRMYKYDILTDTWERLPDPPAGLQGTRSIAARISTYGVNLIMTCGTASGSCTGELYVYKHSNESGIDRRQATEKGLDVQIWPNPFTSAVVLSIPSVGTRLIASLHIHDTNGRLIERIQTRRGMAEWKPADLPPGVYILKANINGRSITRKLILQ